MADEEPRDEEAGEQKVTALELFFDLVFVFAITQVTAAMADEPTWTGLGKGLLVLAAVWWSWVAYSWLTNFVASDEGAARVVMFGAMAAMLVMSLAVPGAFGDDALVFALAFLAVKLLHLGLYRTAARDDPEMMRAVKRLAGPIVIGPALLVGASFLDGEAQAAVWVLALAIDYAGAAFSGTEGWRIHPGHFAERHGLVIIIALGESIVAVGLAAGELSLSIGVLAAAVLGLMIAGTLWWAYFDVVAIVAERKLREATGADRNARARDAYSYLHLPMIAGIVLFALGAKKTVTGLEDPLKWVPAAALCGGVALYLLGHVAFRWRNVRSVNRQRIVAAAALVALVPVAHEVPALMAMGLVFAVCAVLIAYEAVHFREARERIRHA